MVTIEINNVLTKIIGQLPINVSQLIKEACSYSIQGAEFSVYGSRIYCPQCKKQTKEPTTEEMFGPTYPIDGNIYRKCPFHGWVIPISLWDGKNYLFDARSMVFHTGLITRVIDVLKQNGIKYTVQDLRIAPFTHKIAWHGYEPRQYQKNAVREVLKRSRGIIHAATGTGKTLVIGQLIANTCVNTLVLAHTKSVFNQIYNDLNKNLKMPIGRLGDGIVDIKKITVAMPQSLVETVDTYKRRLVKGVWKNVKSKKQQVKEKARDLLTNTEMLLVDECVSGDTEVLTENGWLRIDKYDGASKIAQWDTDGTISFVKPTRVIKSFWEQVYKIPFRRGEIYQTPNHRNPVKTKNGNISVKTPDSLSHGNFFITEGKIADTQRHMTLLEKLIIMTQADGSVNGRDKKTNEPRSWTIQLSKQHKIDEVLSFMKEDVNSEFHFSEISGSPKHGSINERRRFYYVLPKTGPDYKKLSDHFKFNDFDYTKATEFMNEVFKWDSSSYSTKNHTTKLYCTTDEGNADFVQAVGMLAGYATNKTVEYDKRGFKPHYRVYFRTNHNLSCQKTSLESKVVQWNDYMYCVTVPSSFFVIRTCGRTMVTGNCHHISASTVQLVANECPNAFYRVGVSATPWRDDLLDILIEAQTGRTIYHYSATEAIEAGYLARPYIHMVGFKQERQPKYITKYVLNKKTKVEELKTVKMEYADLYDKCVINNIQRNKLIENIVRQRYNMGESILVIVKRLQHGENLHALLKDLDKDIRYVNGEDDPDFLQETLNDLDQKKIRVCIATGIFSEGVDIRRLNTVINTTAMDSSVNAMQVVGRALRKVPGKEEVHIFDIADYNCRWLGEHSKNRLAIYKTEPGYRIIEE